MTRRAIVLGFLLGSLAWSRLAPSPLAADDTSRFGVNIHAPTGGALPLAMDRTAGAGIGWVRIDLVWADVEPFPGVERWRVYDELVAAARARNLEILAIVAYTPAWATDGAAISGVPRAVADWSDFCFRAASRYRDSIRHWEVWNEPNLARFWSGSRLEYIEKILEPASRAIHAASAEARVGGPGLSHDASGGRDWHGWLSDVLREAGEELDFVTHHVYDLDDPAGVLERISGTTAFGDDPSRWHEAAPSLREVLARAGFDRPVWLTETGWQTTRLDESRQAEHYRRFLDLWLGAEAPAAAPSKVFFYELSDSPDPRFPKYGLLRVSGRPKPSYRVLSDFIAAGSSPPGEGEPPQQPPPQPPEPPGSDDDGPPRPRPHDTD